MIRRLAAIAAASAALAGCGGGAPRDAAESASRLLAAALAGDRVAFEAQIDRPAVREDVRRQVADVARGAGLEVEGGPSEFALDRMISPATIRLVLDSAGEALTSAPTPDRVARKMRRIEGQRVCFTGKADDCLLTFAKEQRRWRLVGMKAVDVRLEVAAARR